MARTPVHFHHAIPCWLRAPAVCSAIEHVLGRLATAFPEDYATIRARVGQIITMPPEERLLGYWFPAERTLALWPALVHPASIVAHEFGHVVAPDFLSEPPADESVVRWGFTLWETLRENEYQSQIYRQWDEGDSQRFWALCSQREGSEEDEDEEDGGNNGLKIP